jgi:hypothetical protein
MSFQIHMSDYLNGGTAIHFAALQGHARCLRLVCADYVPSIPNLLNQTNHRSSEEVSDVPSPCTCRLCVKHTKLLQPDESQII